LSPWSGRSTASTTASTSGSEVSARSAATASPGRLNVGMPMVTRRSLGTCTDGSGLPSGAASGRVAGASTVANHPPESSSTSVSADRQAQDHLVQDRPAAPVRRGEGVEVGGERDLGVRPDAEPGPPGGVRPPAVGVRLREVQGAYVQRLARSRQDDPLEALPATGVCEPGDAALNLVVEFVVAVVFHMD